MTTIPFLIVVVVGFPLLVGRYAARSKAISMEEQRVLNAYGILMILWLAFAAIAGHQGWWLQDRFLAALPGLWLPLIPVAIVTIPLFVLSIRSVVLRAGRSVPWRWFATIQTTRLAAIGTAIKTHRGEFPAAVEYLVGVPDLLFGLSAIWMARQIRLGRISRTNWLLWNAIGIAIIVPFGMIVINMSLPGPLQTWTDPPSFLVALEFPLSLAPTAIVPWLIVFNLWAIVSSWHPIAGDMRHVNVIGSPGETSVDVGNRSTHHRFSVNGRSGSRGSTQRVIGVHRPRLLRR
ncbi:MAG: hypothetical protein AAGD07_14665 [Planctomycetota bacterium]